MPKTNAVTARKLARISSDGSLFLTHLVRQNDERRERSDHQARRILCQILDVNSQKPKPCLKAYSTGWYSSASDALVFNPETCDLDGSIQSHAICFTESTLAGLKAHRDHFRAKYGLSFDRDFLLHRGANPCLNIREELLYKEYFLPGEQYPRRVFNFIPEPLQPFVNTIKGNFDFTYEREWRYPDDLPFEYDDVRFIFCPEKEFPKFYDVQWKGLPELFDLAWLDCI